MISDHERYKNRANYRSMGALMPLWFHSYFTLYCVAKGISKATIFKVMAHDWLKNTQPKFPESDLVLELKQRIYANYRYQKRRKKSITHEEFLKRIRADLKSKGLEDGFITFILKQIEPI